MDRDCFDRAVYDRAFYRLHVSRVQERSRRSELNPVEHHAALPGHVGPHVSL